MNRILRLVISVALFAAACQSVPAQEKGQTVTRNFSGTALKSVLEEIESQTRYHFIYEVADINSAPKVTANFKGSGIDAVMRKVLPDGLTYSVNGTMVTIRKDTRNAGASQTGKSPAHFTVKGTVVDSEGLPVPGAAVMVKDDISFGGAITDAKGEFAFTTVKGAILQVSCIGYKNEEKVFNSAGNWYVTLNEESETLDDVVVVGYGTQKKESVVGAISQVEGQALVNSGTTNITNSLAGKLSGVETFQTSGQPGANDATISIRGISSWNGSEPLVMVDGVERSFNDIDPNEVDNISVLKDASATAVFGAKGANGVILVTTKSGVKGKPKMNLTVNYGIDMPTFLPEHVDAETVYGMANIAHRNQQTFGSQFSQDIIDTAKDGYNPLRYPDNDWNRLMIRNMAQNLDANFSVSGGSDRIVYYVFVGYSNDNSLLKESMSESGHSYSMNRINYRSNIDAKLTPTTTLSAKVGGSTTIVMAPTTATSTLFGYIYSASNVMFPAYFPAWALQKVADTDYPDASGIRMADNGAASGVNPFRFTAYDAYQETTTNNLNTDIELKQDLKFITKGLSLKGKFALTTQYSRISMQSYDAYADYLINWDAFGDNDMANPWSSTVSGSYVYVLPPYRETQSNGASNIQKTYYWEASLNYKRKFQDHNVSALLLMHQRERRFSADFPYHTEAYVARATYDYKAKYLFEVNMGYTGSEQFAPSNRYGFFPSVAVGYTLSKEPWWKSSMPWWSKMKIRYSDGLVGSDSASERWLYYSTFEKSTDYYKEDAAANLTARWETAHKRDVGIEMGWFKNALTLDVDLFDEQRTDMLLTPVVTPLVAVSYKDVNIGAMKKHGLEVEAKYRKTTRGGFYYEFGGMAGLNENRIVKYADLPSAPSYQHQQGTAYGANLNGLDQGDTGFFTSVDDLHSYPSGYATWVLLYPGIYKYSDYNADGYINSDDYHPVKGMTYPVCNYSFHAGFGYKGWTFNCMFYGNYGKYSSFRGPYDLEFTNGDLLIHKSQLDYWTPLNGDASVHRIPSFNTQFTSQTTNMAVLGHSWRRSDFLSLKEVYLAYKFDGDKLKKKTGVNGLTLSLTGNNLFTTTGLVEGDPQIKAFKSSYYPLVRIVKFGAKLDF